MEKRFIALVLDIESFIRDNGFDMLELATEMVIILLLSSIVRL